MFYIKEVLGVSHISVFVLMRHNDAGGSGYH